MNQENENNEIEPKPIDPSKPWPQYEDEEGRLRAAPGRARAGAARRRARSVPREPLDATADLERKTSEYL